MAYQKFNVKEQYDICTQYINGQSAVIIAKNKSTSTTTITSILKRNNIAIRSKNISIAMHWKNFKTEGRYQNYIQCLSKRLKNRNFSTITRQKMSKSRAIGIANGTIRSQVYSKQLWYKGFFCRSTYEQKFVDFALKNNIIIEPCKIIIPYYYNGIEKNYVPDFFNPIKQEIFEIKPLELCKTKMNQVKFEAARKYCIKNNLHFTVVTEMTLFNKRMSREEYSNYFN